MKQSNSPYTPKIEISVFCDVRIGQTTLEASVSGVELIQRIDGHHVLNVRVKEVGALGPNDPIDPTPYTNGLGEKITVTIKPFDNLTGSDKSLTFIGLITRVALENSVDGANWILIEAQSPTCLLDSVRHNRLLFNQTDSQAIDTILGEYDITKGVITSTSEQSEQLHQFNETDYEYICRLAARNGLYAYYTGKEFIVGKASSSTSVRLPFEETLGSFMLDLGTTSLGFDAQLMDPKKKEWVSHTQKFPSIAVSGLIKASVDASKTIYNSAANFSYVPSVASPSHVQAVVQNQSSGAAGRLVTAIGQSIDLSIGLGGCVEIAKLGNVGGMYWLTEITHVINDSGQYHNRFQAVPLDLAFAPVNDPTNRSTHLQYGLVADNNDPEKMGRIRVTLPWMANESLFWCRMARPDAGNDRGWFSFPDVGDEVLVGFENGDPDRPVILGVMHNGKDLPPKGIVDGSEVAASESGSDVIKILRTVSGNEILFVDSPGNEKVIIRQTKAKNCIILDAVSGGISITIESEEDINLVAKNITLKAQESVTIEATSKDVKVSAGGNIEETAKANFTAKATADMKLTATGNANLEATASCTVKGTTLSVEGAATGTVKANGPLTVQGMPVKIN